MIMSLFRKKKVCPQDGKFKLLIIDDNSELMHEILGISEDRVKELLKNTAEAFDNNAELHLMLEKIVNYCKHENEIAMSMLIFQKIVDFQKRESTVNEVMSKLFGSHE
jgi:hypothetical protein